MASQWFEIPVLSGPTCCETNDRLRGKRVLKSVFCKNAEQFFDIRLISDFRIGREESDLVMRLTKINVLIV